MSDRAPTDGCSSAAHGIIVADSITKLPPEARGAVVISGSHGGAYPGFLAAQAGIRAVILNDAGVGKDQAGIAALRYLERLGIAAAAVSHASCRIGDATDMLARGRITYANASARAVAVGPGLACVEAAQRLLAAAHVMAEPPPVGEGRAEIPVEGARRKLLLLDSAAMVQPEDAGQIVVTGSHGGLVGGIPAMALRTEAFAAVFNDAGIGIEGAGLTRLPALDRRGIAAFTVAAASARIGDARSVFEDGVVSAANETAKGLGAAPGMAARALLTAWTRS